MVVLLVWLWITDMALLLGAETERARQIETSVAGAERELKLEEREPARVD